jgi:hypothetical protein
MWPGSAAVANRPGDGPSDYLTIMETCLYQILIFVVCFGVGVFAAANRLPTLAEGPIAGVAFFITCGLLGGALALAGLHIYLTVEEINQTLQSKDSIIAAEMSSILFETGSLVGLAGVVHVLAPRLGTAPRSSPSEEPGY